MKQPWASGLIVQWIRTPQVPSSRLSGYSTLSTELLTFYHPNSIIKFSIHCCVWKVMGGFPSGLTDPRH